MGLDITYERNSDLEIKEIELRVEKMFNRSRDEFERAQQMWSQIPRYDTGTRGIGMESQLTRGLRSNFVKLHEKFDKEVEETIENLKNLPTDSGLFLRESILAINKILVQLDGEKKKTDYSFDSESIEPNEPYFVNEALLPVLEIIEARTTDLSRTVTFDSLYTILTKNYQDYREYDPVAMEILKTLIVISDSNNLNKIVDFTSEHCGTDYKITTEETIRTQILHEIDELDWQISERETHYLEQGINIDENDEVLVDSKDRLKNLKEILANEEEMQNVVEMYQPNYSEGDLMYDYNPSRVVHQEICKAILLREAKDSETAKMLASFLSKVITFNSTGSLGEYIEAFEYLGADNSFPYLIENLRSDDELTRRMSAEILYSLEAREKTIDNPEGIEYFKKMYVLVSKEDPEFFVKMYEKRAKVLRLSREKISVIDETGIVGFFQLELENQSNHIRAEVKKLETKDVFLPKADETEEDRLLRRILMENRLLLPKRIGGWQ